MVGEWDQETENWLRWARTPGFDAYWYYRDAFFDSVLPPPGGRTLEVGCGEGRVARDLAALQVVADMRGTVQECARALRHGGHLCFCVAHPVTDMGHWVDDTGPPRFTVRSPYFESTRVEDTVERDGLRMTFRGWTYTLEDYALALNDAGFVIEVIREPTPTSDSRYQRWSELPLFMNVRAVKR